jgi:SSS family solute:Na+ symporter
MILGVINWLMIYGGDQNMVQRYAAARSMREARKATALYSAIALPMWVLFFFVGTALFVYYSKFPDDQASMLEADQVLPYFILTRLPAGVAGILISAVLAAAMSSLDSGINAVSTVGVVDFMKPWSRKTRSDGFYLKWAKVIGLVAILIVMLGAIVFSRIEKESMNDISLIVTSIFGGCLMGLFMIGFFTKHVDGPTATVAMVIAILFNIYLALGWFGLLPEYLTWKLHSYWFGAIVNGLFMAIALAIGSFRRGHKDLAGLTIWTIKSGKDR